MRIVAAIGLAVLCAAAGAEEEGAPPDPAAAKAQPSDAGLLPGWKLSGSLRVRPETWSWFGSAAGDGTYTYIGSLLRLQALRQRPGEDYTLELAVPWLANLPEKASQPPPLGQLGLGGTYRDASGSQEASLFIKQGCLRLKNLGGRGNSLRAGRFEFIEGAETAPQDPTLAWLKRERIAHRLIGNFGFSHVGRSFDGIHASVGPPSSNLTVMAGFPTRGVFDVRGNDTLEDVKTLCAAGTWSAPRSDLRLFGIWYEDSRNGVVKADNRPAAARAADRAPVRVTTLGGHYLRQFPCAAGTGDLLLWAAGQFGSWGVLDQEAIGFAVEAGWQPKGMPWQPWFRGGYFHGSGDGDPADGKHETFFPVLPTPRIYARFPFYTNANLNDAVGQVILRPEPRVTLRADVHRLWLANRGDAWYAGGGAFQPAPSFGYAGRPSGGSDDLGTLLDLSVDYQWRPGTTLSLYLAQAFGGRVVRGIYNGRDASLAYVEVLHRW